MLAAIGVEAVGGLDLRTRTKVLHDSARRIANRLAILLIASTKAGSLVSCRDRTEMAACPFQT